MSCDTSLSRSEAKKLAKKLRAEDPEQFITLVRMHLSFVLDLNTEETDGHSEKSKTRAKWGLVQFSKKLRSCVKESEGVPLTKDVTTQVYLLSQFLTLEENVTQEGIFRRSGKVTRQQDLKSLLLKNDPSTIDLTAYSVHDVASVLKGFLSELPEPLLTEAHYPAFCQIAELCQSEIPKERILVSLQLLLLLLPPENRRTLKHILKLLNLTSSHVDQNRMSSQNLATMFTPHLICPRKLSPEVFHATAQNLSCIVVFMINEGVALFEVPAALATDIIAYWDRRRRNNSCLERSISEANTVFSFVDRERTAQENVTNPTETALAQLYAHIQALPESNKNKKRLIKQFNKENGQGTPRTKSLSDSIKKHIFCKNAKAKGYADFNVKNGLNSEFNTPERRPFRAPLSKLRLNMGNNDDTKKDDDDGSETDSSTTGTPPHVDSSPGNFTGGVTSTPACTVITPSGLALDDMSPITRSAQRMPKAMQEAMITPRSRKPVVALSGSHLHLGSAWESNVTAPRLSWGHTGNESKLKTESGGEDSLTSPFRDYLFSRSVLTGSPADLSFSSRTGDFDPSSSSCSMRTTANGDELDVDAPEPTPTAEVLSESLLYFLDGGSLPSSTEGSGRRLKRERPQDDFETSGKRSELEESFTETSL